jgi:serine/threonine-protein kinase ULK/ATG1
LASLPILKLGDFGFARSLVQESLASTLCGSPLYMAPEILRGEKYDAKTDLWSVGAIVYEMITGKTPFRAQNHIELLRKIEKGDGWIRFPDETADENVGYQPREYHGGIQRPTIHHRKSLAYMPTSQATDVHVGSLGSSPRFGGLHKTAATPLVPEDLKNLTRRLLKRNPVERMTFEEFFIHPAVLECRDMDTKAQSLLSTLEKDKREQDQRLELLLEAPFFEPSPRTTSFEHHTVPDVTSVQAPFPGYKTDPDWLEKVMVEPKLPSLQSTFPRMDPNSNQLSRTPTIDPPIPASMRNSSSFGSSIGSIEFSSDEEKPTRTPVPESPQKSTKGSQEMLSSDDFVVIEKSGAEVNWNPSAARSPVRDSITVPNEPKLATSALTYGSSPLGNPAFIPPSSSFHSPDKPYFSPKAMDQMRKARLFGSLRLDHSGFGIRQLSQVIELEPTQLFGPLPYVIDFSTMSANEKIQIEQLNLSAARALCVSELANQMFREFESLPPVPSSPTRKNVIGEESLQLLVFSLGLWQFALNNAKSLVHEYKSRQISNPTTYGNALTTITRFLQTRFSECLSHAEKLRQYQLHSETSRPPHRVIYETALTTAKHGALSELKAESYEGLYKTSVLLLQAILQPPYDESMEKLDSDDTRLIQSFLNQLYVRLYKK